MILASHECIVNNFDKSSSREVIDTLRETKMTKELRVCLIKIYKTHQTRSKLDAGATMRKSHWLSIGLWFSLSYLVF